MQIPKEEPCSYCYCQEKRRRDAHNSKLQEIKICPPDGGLADHILPLFLAHQCYVEPFAGAAALFFLKRPSDVEVINDINGDLVNLYRVVKHHLEELYRQFKWALTSRQNWEWLQTTPPQTLTDVQRASR